MSTDQHHFELNLDRAIREQVVEMLENSPLLALERSVGPQESRRLCADYKDELVYIGKASKATTKSGRTLRARLNEHVGKISGRREHHSERRQVSLPHVRQRVVGVCLGVRAHHAIRAQKWNESGFGSKGARRGTSRHRSREVVEFEISTYVLR